jgi:uncharacterized Zn finger protein (UPF0148 family)
MLNSIRPLFLYVLLAGTLFCSSCQNNPISQQSTELEASEVLYNEVMEIHDDVMPKMSRIAQLQEELKEKLKANSESESNLENAKMLLSKLNEAEQAMWDWMHEFSDSYGQKLTEQEKMEYLEAEKIRITEVKDKMLNSISIAETAISNENE